MAEVGLKEKDAEDTMMKIGDGKSAVKINISKYHSSTDL